MPGAERRRLAPVSYSIVLLTGPTEALSTPVFVYDATEKYQVPAASPGMVALVVAGLEMVTSWFNAPGEVPYRILYPARFVSAEPSSFRVGAVQLRSAEPTTGVADFTTMPKAGRVAEATPSETEMTMFEKVLTSVAVGVPDNLPVLRSNVAQPGLFAMPKPSVWPSGSEAVGTNEYGWPTVTVVAGVPEIVGARFGAAETVMENAGSEAVALPSETEIVIPLNVPAEPFGGVPLNLPVEPFKVSQDGAPDALNVSVSPSGSLAVG